MRADAYFTNQNNLESEFIISRLGVRVPPSAFIYRGNSRYAVPRFFDFINVNSQTIAIYGLYGDDLVFIIQNHDIYGFISLAFADTDSEHVSRITH